MFKVTASNNNGSDSKNTTVIYRPVTSPQADPVITLVNPSGTTMSTTTSAIVVTANIANINSASDVRVRLNGTAITTFTFANGLLTVNANMVNGTNTLELRAINSIGYANKTITVTYAQPQKTQSGGTTPKKGVSGTTGTTGTTGSTGTTPKITKPKSGGNGGGGN